VRHHFERRLGREASGRTTRRLLATRHFCQHSPVDSCGLGRATGEPLPNLMSQVHDDLANMEATWEVLRLEKECLQDGRDLLS
jgi:hypothetical protein